MRILVCGGREYSDFATLTKTLDAARAKHGDIIVIHGGARGADSLAGKWADLRGVPCIGMNAAWTFYKNRAGPIRNQWMLDHAGPQAVIAFPGGTGTADMVTRAKAADLPVWEPAK